MLVAVHPDLQLELEFLANLGFSYEYSMGALFGLIDNLFRGSVTDAVASQNWAMRPLADNGLSVPLDLRCIDPDDGRITLIATTRGNILYLLSAGQGTNAGRASAIRDAAARVVNLSWAQPE